MCDCYSCCRHGMLVNTTIFLTHISFSSTLQTLNSTFYKAFKPKVRDISQLVSFSGQVLGQFNTTFAVKP